jgi:hypothetical protein
MPESQIKWETNMNEALNRAVDDNKLIVLDFFNPQ